LGENSRGGSHTAKGAFVNDIHSPPIQFEASAEEEDDFFCYRKKGTAAVIPVVFSQGIQAQWQSQCQGSSLSGLGQTDVGTFSLPQK